MSMGIRAAIGIDLVNGKSGGFTMWPAVVTSIGVDFLNANDMGFSISFREYYTRTPRRVIVDHDTFRKLAINEGDKVVLKLENDNIVKILVERNTIKVESHIESFEV